DRVGLPDPPPPQSWCKATKVDAAAPAAIRPPAPRLRDDLGLFHPAMRIFCCAPNAQQRRSPVQSSVHSLLLAAATTLAPPAVRRCESWMASVGYHLRSHLLTAVRLDTRQALADATLQAPPQLATESERHSKPDFPVSGTALAFLLRLPAGYPQR